MDATEIAAIVGAAAWLPILGQWVYRTWIAKPKLDVVVGSSGELGYTTFGAVLNPDLALRVQGKPALITKITIDLRHQQGRQTTLHWNGTTEVLQQAQSNSGDHASFTRTHSAVAMQVLPNTDVVPRKFQFNDSAAGRLFNEKSVLLARRLDRLPPPILLPAVQQSDEYIDLAEHGQESFPWEAGDYTATLSVEVQELKKPVSVGFSFSINAMQVTRIQANVATIKQETDCISINTPNAPLPVWNWTYPTLTRV